MDWISRFFLKYTLALMLTLTALLSTKFLVDHCTPDYDYRFFATSIKVPQNICTYIEGWDSSARAKKYSSGSDKGLFAEKSNFFVEIVETNNSSEILWLDSLPLLINSKRTAETTTKLILITLIPPLLIVLLFELLSSIFILILPAQKKEPSEFMKRIVEPKDDDFLTSEKAARILKERKKEEEKEI